jgi:hypothetical protein
MAKELGAGQDTFVTCREPANHRRITPWGDLLMPGQPISKAAEPSPLKYWALIAFESMGAGALAITLAFAVVLVAVGIYVQIIWPLTDWDLVSVSLDPYYSQIVVAIVFIFLTGTAVGFWFVSGAAWQTRKQTPATRGIAAGRRVSRTHF